MQATLLNLNNLKPCPENRAMVTFYNQLETYLKGLSEPVSFYKLQFLSGIPSGTFSQWKNGKRMPSDADIEKLATVEEIGIDKNTLYAWRAMDEYPPKVINIASADTLTIDFIKEELLPRLSKEDRAELLKGLKKQ